MADRKTMKRRKKKFKAIVLNVIGAIPGVCLMLWRLAVVWLLFSILQGVHYLCYVGSFHAL